MVDRPEIQSGRSGRAAANFGRVGVIIAGLRRPAANRPSAGDTPVV